MHSWSYCNSCWFNYHVFIFGSWQISTSASRGFGHLHFSSMYGHHVHSTYVSSCRECVQMRLCYKANNPAKNISLNGHEWTVDEAIVEVVPKSEGGIFRKLL